MDYLRVLLVPFQAATLLLVAIFSLFLSVLDFHPIIGLFGKLLIQVWILKYCYVLLDHVAEGRMDPPVMSAETLSPFEIRPWIQLAFIVMGAGLCLWVGGTAGVALGVILLVLLPASIAVLGFGEPAYEAVNPVTLFRVVRGLGPLYLALLAAMVLYAAIGWFIADTGVWRFLVHAVHLLCEISFFSLIGGCMYLRRRQLGYEASESPERAAQKAESERTKARARMVDDVFQLARVGRQVDATAPLAQWLRDLDADYACRDSYYVAEQVLRWENPAAVNTIGSTLIRHLLRFGRPDAALAVFERLRAHSAHFTMDSAPDLRTLAEFAESTGRGELAATMRLETPIHHPQSPSPRRT
jgi:hypothetical protein